jgi:hypothetical protein
MYEQEHRSILLLATAAIGANKNENPMRFLNGMFESVSPSLPGVQVFEVNPRLIPGFQVLWATLPLAAWYPRRRK